MHNKAMDECVFTVVTSLFHIMRESAVFSSETKISHCEKNVVKKFQDRGKFMHKFE